MMEPLVSQHPLGMQLMYETTPDFANNESVMNPPNMTYICLENLLYLLYVM
jgi:hypothetical protein